MTPALSDSEDDGDGSEAELEATEQGRHRRHLATPAHSTIDPERRFAHRFARKLHRIWVKFNDFMTIPLWASLLSILVACIRPLQHALEEHMPPVTGALRSAGNCSIPLTLVVLGAYFYPSKDEEPADGGRVALSSRQRGKKSRLMVVPSNETLVQSMKGYWQLPTFSKSVIDADGETRARKVKKAVPGETKTVMIAVLSRMIITPLLLMPLVALAAKFGWQEVLAEFVFPCLFGFVSRLLMVFFSQSCVCHFECVIGLVASGVDSRSGTVPDLFSSYMHSNCSYLPLDYTSCVWRRV